MTDRPTPDSPLTTAEAAIKEAATFVEEHHADGIRLAAAMLAALKPRCSPSPAPVAVDERPKLCPNHPAASAKSHYCGECLQHALETGAFL